LSPAPEETETPETHQKVIAKLEGAGLTIVKTHHAPVKTSEEAAQVRGFPLECGAKAIVMSVKLKGTQGVDTSAFVLFVMSATHKLDSKKARKLVAGCKSMSFATPEQVKALTGCIPGAVPPFGSVWGIQTYMDISLRKVGEFIDFNAGLRTDSVHMRQDDYEKVEQPIVSEFANPP
jgi:Ala-tRNA(Pro) deacylase